MTTKEPGHSVPALLMQRAENDPDSLLIQDVSGPSITSGAFHRAALEVAEALAGLGVLPGDCVATLGDPSIAAHIGWIGICWAGAMEVPVNPEFRGNTLIYGISDCRARILITTNAYLEKIWPIRDELPHLRQILTLDAEVPEQFDGVQSLAALRRGVTPRNFPVPELTDPYAVIYTSGTTGPSKGVVVPWGSLEYAVLDRLFPGDSMDHGDAGAFYSPWPMFHSSGRTGLAFAALTGGRFVIRDRLSASAFWQDVRAFGITHTHLLGIAGFLMVHPSRGDDADNPLQRVLMNPVIADYRAFEKRFGVKVSTGWGMTEIGFPTAASDLPNARTCGRLSPLYEARLVGADGNDVPDGEVGQLVIKPRRPWLLLREYLGNAEASAKAWRDGWFQSGDALLRGADGYYYFVDRVADYLRVRGNNVSSVELENEVRAHPDIDDVAAIGVPADQSPSPPGGSRPRAIVNEDEIKIVVQRREGSKIGARELLAFLDPRLPPFMMPRFIEFTAAFPRTPTGKIQKKTLRDGSMAGAVWDRFAPDVEA